MAMVECRRTDYFNRFVSTLLIMVPSNATSALSETGILLSICGCVSYTGETLLSLRHATSITSSTGTTGR